MARLRSKTFVAAGVVSVAALAVAATPQLLGPEVADALGRLRHAEPGWVWLAATSFVVALAANAFAWRAAIGVAGGCISRTEAVACYGIGSLVNSAAVARIGDAVRIALFSRAFEGGRERLWTTGGTFAAIGAARALCLAALIVFAAVSGAVPLWPVLVLGGLAAAAIGIAVLVRGTDAHGRVSHALDAFRGLGRSPVDGLRILGWIVCASGARLVGVAAIAAAFGVHSPLVAAAIIVPALDLAGLIPLTPGNVALGSGTVAVALESKGVALETALATGIALHAAETAASIVVGVAGALVLARFSSPSARRWTLRAAAVTACFAVAALLGVTFLLQLA